jgi:outer membrane lipoprotein-sorting protein
MWLYTADAKQVIEQKELGSSSGVEQLIDNLSNLGSLFDVTVAPPSNPPRAVHVVTLKPKQAGAVKSLELTVTKQKYQLQELVLVDQADGVTRMSFTLVRTNIDIPDIEFTFKAPPGVTVVKM